MWQPGWEGNLGENGYRDMYGWVLLLFIWNYHTLLIGCVLCCAVLSLFSHVRLFGTLWTVALQASLSMGILQARILEWVVLPSCRCDRISFPPSLHPCFLPPSLPAENRVLATLASLWFLLGFLRGSPGSAQPLNSFVPFRWPLKHCNNPAWSNMCGNLSWRITTGCCSGCGKNAECFLC